MTRKLRRPKHKIAPFPLIHFMAISSEDAQELEVLKGIDKKSKISFILEEKGFVEFQFPEHNRSVWVHENGIQIWEDNPDHQYGNKSSYFIFAATHGANHLGNFDQRLRASSYQDQSWCSAGGERYGGIMFEIKPGQELSLFTNSRNSYLAYLKNENILPAKQYPFVLNSDATSEATSEMCSLARFLGCPTPEADIVKEWFFPNALDASKVKNALDFKTDMRSILDLDATRRAGLSYYLEGITSIPDSDKQKISAWNGLAVELKELRYRQKLGDCPEEVIKAIANSEPLSTGYSALSFFANSGVFSVDLLRNFVEKIPEEALRKLSNTEDTAGFSPALCALNELYNSVENAWPVFEAWGEKIGWENMRLSSKKLNWTGVIYQKEDSFTFEEETSNQWALQFLDVIKQNKGLEMPDCYKSLQRSKYLGTYEINESLLHVKENLHNPRYMAIDFKEETLDNIHKLLGYRMEILLKQNVKHLPNTLKPPSINRF